MRCLPEPDARCRSRAHARYDFLDVRVQRFRVPRCAQRDVHFGGTCRHVLENSFGCLRRCAEQRAAGDACRGRAPVFLQTLRFGGDAFFAGGEIEHDVHRTTHTLGIALLPFAPTVEHAVQAAELLRRDVGGVPAVGVPGNEAQRALLADAADPDRQTPLHRPRQTRRIVNVKVFAVKGGSLLGEHAADDSGRFVEHVETRFEFRKFVAVRLRFPEVPTRADAEFEAAAADVIERGRRFCEHRRIAIADVEDETAEAGVLGFSGERAERCQRFEVRLCATRGRRFVEMIPGGDPVETRAIEFAPQRAHLVHRHVLLPDVGTQRQCHIGPRLF